MKVDPVEHVQLSPDTRIVYVAPRVFKCRAGNAKGLILQVEIWYADDIPDLVVVFREMRLIHQIDILFRHVDLTRRELFSQRSIVHVYADQINRIAAKMVGELERNVADCGSKVDRMRKVA